jgi:flagellar basal-body rod modification protein FlgD
MSISDINAASGVKELLSAPQQEEIGKEAFLKLLVAQMEYQDPLDPTDNTEFVAQLAQFSSLEAMQNIQTDMGDVSFNMNALRHQSSTGLVGKQVKVEGTDFTYRGEPVPLAYDLEGSASDVAIEIFNSSGKLVKTLKGDVGQAGEYNAVWDGLDVDGNPVPEGNYSVNITAVDEKANSVDTVTYVSDVVTSVLFEGGESFLTVGASLVPISKIKGVYTN